MRKFNWPRQRRLSTFSAEFLTVGTRDIADVARCENGALNGLMTDNLDTDTWPLLHLAAYNADDSGARAAIRGGEAIDAYDSRGFTPLLWSCFRGAVGNQQPVLRALLAAGADANAETLTGDANCIMLAAQSGKTELLAMLVQGGAEIDRAVDGVTALMIAARNGDEATVQELLRLGARREIAVGGYTAADYARYAGHDELADAIDGACRGDTASH